MKFGHAFLCGGLVLAAAITAAGCGSTASSTSGSATTPAASTTQQGTTTTRQGTAPDSAALAKFTACLTKEGVTLPTFRTRQGGAGGTPPEGPANGEGGTMGTAPEGAPNGGTPPTDGPGTGTRPTQTPAFQAAMAKCRSLAPEGFGAGGQGRGQFRQGGGGGNNQQFAQFTACMKKNGITLPTGGQATTTPIDRTSAAYKKAEAACSSLLQGPGGTTTTGTGTTTGTTSG